MHNRNGLKLGYLVLINQVWAGNWGWHLVRWNVLRLWIVVLRNIFEFYLEESVFSLTSNHLYGIKPYAHLFLREIICCKDSWIFVGSYRWRKEVS